MTRKEKVAKERPSCVNHGYLGGVVGCPDEYPFLGTSGANMTKCIRRYYVNGEEIDCKACWNQELPEQPQWQKTFMDRFMNVI